MEAQPRQRPLTKFKEICCWKLLPARRQCEGFSPLLTGFGQTARVYMHTMLFFFFFHSDWNRSDWRFQFNCLHGMWSIPNLVCLHERLHLADRWKCLGIDNKTKNNEGLSRYWDAATVEAQRGPAVCLWVFSWMFFFKEFNISCCSSAVSACGNLQFFKSLY